MATRVNLDDDVYAQLQEESSPKERVKLKFPEWDILKELDRRTKRVRRDDGRDIREWMRQHPEEVARVRAKLLETLGG